MINLFRQEFNVSVCSAQRKIFVITCVFDTMKFDNLLHFFFNYSYFSSTSYKLEVSNLSPIRHLPAQTQQ